MPTYRVHTDKGTLYVKGVKTPEEASAAATADILGPGVTVDVAPPSARQVLTKGLEDVSNVTSGGEPNASFGRSTGRAAGATAGGIAGGAVGGPFAPITAPIGAGVGAMAAEALMQLGSGEPFQKRRIAKQGGAAALTEGVGQVAGKVAGPVLREVGLARELTPAQDLLRREAARRGIPLRASEVTESRGLANLERAPSRFPTGSGPYEALSETQGKAVVGAVKAATRVPDLEPREVQAELQRVGELAQTDIPKALEARQRLQTRLYNRIEHLAGDEPVVDIGPVVQRAMRFQKDAQVISGPRAVTTLARKGEAAATVPDEMKAVLKGLGYSEGEVPEWAHQVLQGQPVDLRVPFRVARQLETELGEQARFGTQTSVSKSRTRALYAETRKQIGAYLDSPEGAAVKPELAQAKALTRETHKLFDRGVNSQLLSKNPEQVVERAFRPGNITDLRRFKEAVRPQTFEATKIAWMAGLIDQATSGGKFQPARFQKLIKPYLDSGQVGEAFGSQVESEMRTLSDIMGRMKAVDLASANPSGTGQAVGGIHQLLLGASVLGGLFTGHAVGGMVGPAADLAIPYVASKWFASNQGINTLMRGFSGKYSGPALKAATQLAVQAAEAGAQ